MKNNQTAAALAGIATSVNWERKDFNVQAVIEAANQGKLGESLTNWLASQGWNDTKAVEAVVAPTAVEFCIEVDYSMSLNKMISAGNYDWKNDDITVARFPVKGEGKVQFEAKLFHFNRNISSEAAVTHIKDADPQNPWEPAKTEHTLAFGAKYPQLQREYPIVGLGSVAGVRFGRGVLLLGGVGSDRDLGLSRWGGVWSGHFRFLAVRKVSQPSAT
jgi:hypothetical protein